MTGGIQLEDQFNGFRYDVTCYCCRRVFDVFEGTQAYDRVKRNRKGMHCCEDCKQRIELEARLQFGKRLLGIE